MTLLKSIRKLDRKKLQEYIFCRKKLIISRRKKSAAPGLSNGFFSLLKVFENIVSSKNAFFALFPKSSNLISH